VNTIFYAEVDELLTVVDRLAKLMEEANIPYELVGGMAVFLHVREVSEENARLTNDVDVAIRRADLDTLKRYAPRHGFEFRHAAGIDMLIDSEKRKAKGAIHFVFAGEKVRREYLAPVPEITTALPTSEIRIAPISHLLEMKLTSNRLKDMTHVRDMLNVGLITPEMEAALPEQLRERFDFIKSHE
jgi:hypothetical protein